jgi:hypothetical protein
MPSDDVTELLPARRDDPRLRSLDALGELLDDSIPIPGTRRRIGLDALIGLLPGVGDLVGALLSTYIIAAAARLGVSRATLLRMAANVGVEALVGMVPLLGDLFDAGWKANLRNLRLVRRSLESPQRTTRASRLWVAGVVAGVGLGVLAMGAGAIWLAAALLEAVGLR